MVLLLLMLLAHNSVSRFECDVSPWCVTSRLDYTCDAHLTTPVCVWPTVFVRSWVFCMALVELLVNDSLVGGVACRLLSYCANTVMAICIYIIQNVWYFIVRYTLFLLFFFLFSLIVFSFLFFFLLSFFFFFFWSVYSIFLLLIFRSNLFSLKKKMFSSTI